MAHGCSATRWTALVEWMLRALLSNSATLTVWCHAQSSHQYESSRNGVGAKMQLCHTRALWHIRPLLTLEFIKIVALVIVAAHLDYCNSSSDNLWKLQVTQNALARVVCQGARTCSATELRRTLHRLSSETKHRLQAYSFDLQGEAEWKSIVSGISYYLLCHVPSHSLRSSDKQLLSCPYTSLIMADKPFYVSVSKIWNDLSFNYHDATCVN